MLNNSNILSSGDIARAMIENKKSISELIVIVRNEFRDNKFVINGYAGICDCVHTLFQQKIISTTEYSSVYNHIFENRPENTKNMSAYWWNAYDKESRINFLESLTKVNRN